MNMNTFYGVGNLTKDPEIKKVGEVDKVTFSLAISTSRNRGKDKSEEVGFFDCEAWSSAANIINTYGKKGRRMLIQGILRQDRWTDAQGNNKSKYVIRVEEFMFLDSNFKKTEATTEPKVEKEQKPVAATPF